MNPIGLQSTARLHLFSLCTRIFCAKSHLCNVFRPDAIGTVTVDEKERFENLKESLREYLEKQVTNFRLIRSATVLCRY